MHFGGDEIYFANTGYANMNNEVATATDISRKFQDFLKDWTVEKQFVYRDQLIKNGAMENYFIKVNLSDIEAYDLKLSMEIRTKPFSNLAVLEKAAKELFLSMDISKNESEVPEFQIQFTSGENAKRLRHIKSEDIGKIIQLQGIIVNAGKVLIKGRVITLQCKKCQHTKTVTLDHGLSSLFIPAYCERMKSFTTPNERCPPNSYTILSDKCDFVDFQILKIQESSDSIPTGEVPRTYQICCERYLIDQLIPGNKVTITGIYTVMEKKAISSTSNINGLKVPYVYVLGFENEMSSGRSYNPYFTPVEEARFIEMSQDPKIFEKICSSIAPSIFGHVDVKKAVTCLLFSGSRKVLPDKTRLRGDINVLLWGDPSTAKSQILKFVHKIFPVCIYTSGKGSSAAGLTAAITKDASTREFQLEGGALVLADGGIVCIDEFDKMRAQDRVAIHEAMEQQTISIAKAGITTILNSRTAILAAANPIFGSFNDLKNYSDQMDLQTTILSRFDCIFTIRDDKSVENNAKVATHVLNLHLRQKTKVEENQENDLAIIKKYITYARLKCSPRLSEEAALTLVNMYVDQRSKIGNAESKGSHIPITVRQLEAIIRLSEAIAKTRLANTVTKEDALMANEIFEVSTIRSIKNEKIFYSYNDPEFNAEVLKIEQYIQHKLPISKKVSQQNLIDELEQRYTNQNAVREAILMMIRKEELRQSSKNDILTRVK
jgi:DNA replication licensing factor MCM5